jgi:hypothetical protein
MPVEGAPPPTDGPSLSVGKLILYNQFRNPLTGARELDTVVRAGSRFVSEVVLQNEGGEEHDRVQLALQYDKRFMQPVRVFDEAMRGLAKGSPRFELDERNSMIVYDATLAEARDAKDTTVLTIVWEAIRPTEYAGLRFQFARPGEELGPGHHTAVYLASRNVLGDETDPLDGVLGGSLLILPPFDPTQTEGQILQGKKEELRGVYLTSVGSDVPAGLRLVGPATPPAVGEDFTVDLALENPHGAMIDAVSAYILFDPAVLRVVDTDRGNWVKRGTNILDGPFRADYPWEFHTRNEVDNTRGRIQYSKGLGDQLALPTGTFARITFRALAPTAETKIEMARSRQGAGAVTAVRSFGYDLFSEDPRYTTPWVSGPVLAEPLAAERAGEEAKAAFDPSDPSTVLPHFGVYKVLMPMDVPEELRGQDRL